MEAHKRAADRSLANSLARAIDEVGIGILQDPKRLVSFVLDLADASEPQVRVFVGNCDKALLQPYAEAVVRGGASDVESAAMRACALLRDERFIRDELAEDVSHALASAMAWYVGVHLSDTFEVAAVAYDAFVCCRMCEEATGEGTPDAELATRLANALVKAGLRVFYAPTALQEDPPERYDARVDEARNESRTMVLVSSSSRHLVSPWVRQQWEAYARVQGGQEGRIVVWNAGMPEGDLPQALETARRLDGSRRESFRLLVEHIRRMMTQPMVADGDSGTGKHGDTSQSTLVATPSQKTEPSSLGQTVGRHQWHTANGIRYRFVTLETEEGTANGLLVRTASLSRMNCIVTLALPDGSRTTRWFDGVRMGEEHLQVIERGTRLVSVDTREADETLGPLVVLKQSRINNKRLFLVLANRGEKALTIEKLRVVVGEGALRTFTIDASVMLAPGKTRVCSSLLTTWESNALSASAGRDFDLFVDGGPMILRA